MSGAGTRPDRADHALSAAFAKDPADESFLEHLNDALLSAEEAIYAQPVQERWPTLHVLGAPRSGTTLVTQLIAAHLRVAPISNLAAAFWAAPVHGLRLSKKLLGIGRPSSYRSAYGRTKDPGEPHEFGYFWSRTLGYRHMVEPDDPAASPVDWPRVGRVLAHMTHAAGAPVVFKSFMAGFYTTELQAQLPRTRFLLVTRDPVENALSILKMRREYSGDLHAWTGLKPREFARFASEAPEVQVAAQVLYTELAFLRAFRRVGGHGCLHMPYEQLCASPANFIGAVQGLLDARDAPVPRLEAPLPELSARPVPEGRPGERAAVQRAIHTLREADPELLRTP